MPLTVLGIESSCDDTAAAVVTEDRRVLSSVVSGQAALHAAFGGVVPEIAARAHVEALDSLIAEALSRAETTLDEIDAVAATSGPGLIGGVMVGLVTGKALAHAAGKPFVAVNHLEGHALSPRLTEPDLHFPYLLLLVSGGHTEILRVGRISSEVELLGSTIDDAAGEAYDKVARLIGAGYPGGPVIDRLAAEGDPTAFRFPRGLTAGKFVGSAEEPGPHRHDWSFSGLKTAVSRAVEQFEARGLEVPRADIAASFQEAVADVITAKAVRACREHGLTHLMLGGGVAANSRLRALLADRCRSAGIELTVPPVNLCTDNGAMVAALGARLVRDGVAPSDAWFGADPGQPVEIVSV